MNATMKKFGAPGTLIREYDHWAVLLRPGQVTLGSLVLICKEPATAFSMISGAAFAELQAITGHIEGVLGRTFNYDRINYLMLMMVDPDVHFHVIPRYAEPRTFCGQAFMDPGWPGPPDLATLNATAAEQNHQILTAMKTSWP
ncbi:MAG: HIT family protein [Gammaproteobacteria bacterium]|jgi:diadenosine tetraphosphate (Ap4A) HIT family hydrolase